MIAAAETALLVIICFGALTGNVTLFVIIAKTPLLRTKGNLFILNLAVADLLIAVISIPITIVTIISEDWVLGEKVCTASGFFTLLTFVASCVALTMISVNRYHAICHWIKYEKKYTRGACVVYVAGMWAIIIGLSVPPLFGWAKFAYDKGQSYCFVEWSSSKSYTIFMIVSCLFGPVTVMTFCYVRIYKFKKASSSNVQSSTQHPTTKIAPHDVHRKGKVVRQSAVRSDRKLSCTIFTLVVVFVLCWSPFACIMLLQVFFDVRVPRWADFGSLVLGYANSFCNVFVYNATNKQIRSRYVRLLGCKRNRAHVGSQLRIKNRGK